MYVYIHSETSPEGHWPYTVGFYDPKGKWVPESDHDSEEKAAARVHYLNGGRLEHCSWCPDPRSPNPKHHPGGQVEHVEALTGGEK